MGWRGSGRGGRDSEMGLRGLGRGGRDSEMGLRGLGRGGRDSEMGWRGSGTGWRGSENSMHGTTRGQVYENQDDRLLPSGPTYMASPHQQKFEQRGRGRGRAGRGQERGGFWGQRGGRGGSRAKGGFGGGGFGRGSAAGSREGDVWDERVSVSDVGGERIVGFGKEERGKGRSGDGMVNRRVGFRDAEAATVVSAASLRGVNTRGRGGREGEVRGRGRGDRGRGSKGRRKGRRQ
ncbi:TATA-binding protein-associated factor 2N-like [Mizuhopecten yessoensis]|nr:TATA-binding protein-associated factor 2N-like [Mizuhopecten yessoensis]